MPRRGAPLLPALEHFVSDGSDVRKPQLLALTLAVVVVLGRSQRLTRQELRVAL